MKVFFDVYLRLRDKDPQRVGVVCGYQSPQGVVVNAVLGVRYEPGYYSVKGCLPIRYRRCFDRASRTTYAPTGERDGWLAQTLLNHRGHVVGSVWAIPRPLDA